MKILLTRQNDALKQIYFNRDVIEKLQDLGELKTNPFDCAFSTRELKNAVVDVDICLTHWGCPRFTADIIENAPQLKMIAHAAGSVAGLVDKSVYDQGIKVCSANAVIAKYVAEAVLAYVLASLRCLPQYTNSMVEGLWHRDVEGVESLYGKKFGFIALGTVGTYLLPLLAPFNVKVRIYDPYTDRNGVMGFDFVEFHESIDDVLAWSDIISIHASKTPETYHMIDEERLKLIRDDTLLINTSRGANIDEKALIHELRSRRFRAVLDVFEEEPLSSDSPLRNLPNVLLVPHMAGAPTRTNMSYAMLEDIERFIAGKPLFYEIPFNKYALMTR